MIMKVIVFKTTFIVTEDDEKLEIDYFHQSGKTETLNVRSRPESTLKDRALERINICMNQL